MMVFDVGNNEVSRSIAAGSVIRKRCSQHVSDRFFRSRLCS